MVDHVFSTKLESKKVYEQQTDFSYSRKQTIKPLMAKHQ